MGLKVIALSITLFGLAACSDHDEAYYKSNIEDAEAKVEDCEAELKEAFSEQDKEAFKAIADDPECKAADKAVKAYKRELRNIELEKQRKEREEQKKQDELKYQQEYSEQKSRLSELSFEEFVAIKAECRFSGFRKPKPLCKAYKELKDTKYQQKVDALMEQYQDEALVEYKNSHCKSYSDSNKPQCEVAKLALEQYTDSRIEYYVEHKDELITVFNDCQSSHKKLRKENRWDDANALLKTYRCKTAGEAAKKFKVYSFSKPIK